MRNLLVIALICGASLLTLPNVQAQNRCEPLQSPRYGTMMCTDGSENLSRCQFICDEDYKLSERSSRNRRCICRNGECEWEGIEAVCEYQAPSQVFCDTPDFQSASYGIKDVWPSVLFLDISIMPTRFVTQGWSIALMFFDPLPEGFGAESGHVKLSAVSEDRRILTFNSRSNNKDLSGVQIYNFIIAINNIPASFNPSKYAALIGFFNKVVEDASCIQVISPIRPLPTTTAATTQSTSTIRARRTARPTRPSRPRRTTRRPPTTTTTTTRTTNNPPSLASDCEILDDPSQPGYVLLNSGWNGGDSWKFSGRFEKYSENREISDWMFKAEFPEAISNIEIFTGETEGPFSGGRVWFIKPKPWNKNARGDLKLNFIGSINGGSEGPATESVKVTFCRNGVEPDRSLTPGGGNGGRVRPRPATTTASAESGVTMSTTTLSPQFLTNCRANGRDSFGILPPRSAQTDPSGYNRGSRNSYDYNKVLHMSVLFYEAQRSGKLPANNRIPWRGDSGLKDGCDKGVDLTGGFYDAGDNVKFGFPMAYTMTVLAWGMIEFQNAYVSSGDWQAAQNILKWGTDYLIKAHTAKYELYVQVGDASKDHGSWLRPEDITYVQDSYKIDTKNAGTEVAAETAAAMAAASLVFRRSNAQYANTLVTHAKQLFEFADKYRRPYHDSVPGVSQYYRSWSGYQDELLWAAAWLTRATSQEKYLSYVRDNYDRFGAGHAPGEFSWDNKYAGVQVLMAQITKEQKYTNDVKAFFKKLNNVRKTPRGLTWFSQWGSNRYAANFAFISVVASKVAKLGQDSEKFVSYARSQIHYILGDNELNKPYVVGMSSTSPKRPHHRASSCPAWPPLTTCGFNALNRDGPNPHVLYGALVGGPNSAGEYTDDRSDYISNEVALDYNAGFQGAVAGLQSIRLG